MVKNKEIKSRNKEEQKKSMPVIIIEKKTLVIVLIKIELIKIELTIYILSNIYYNRK